MLRIIIVNQSFQSFYKESNGFHNHQHSILLTYTFHVQINCIAFISSDFHDMLFLLIESISNFMIVNCRNGFLIPANIIFLSLAIFAYSKIPPWLFHFDVMCIKTWHQSSKCLVICSCWERMIWHVWNVYSLIVWHLSYWNIKN